MPLSSSVFPALSCISFKVLGLLLKCLIHFELMKVKVLIYTFPLPEINSHCKSITWKFLILIFQ
jgi:hypothetical protein